MEDELRPLTSQLDDGTGINDTDTSIVVDTGTGTYFREGDIVLMESELIRITAVAGDTLTTVAAPNGRGWGGSVAASHADNTVIQIVSVAIVEGDPTPGVSRTTVKVEKSNYTQIFEDVVEISATLEAVDQYASGSEYARQLAKTMKSLMIVIDKTFYYGKPSAGSSTVPRAMAGLRHFLTTNVVDASAAALSEAFLLDDLHSVYDDGGDPKCIFMTLRQKRFFNLLLGTAVRRTTLEERTAGSVVDYFTWDNGTLDVVIDRWMPLSEIVYLSPEFIGFGPLQTRNLQHEILPKQSREVQRGQITGEYTLEVKSEKAHARRHNLDTSP
jgi:hypothetical protein